MIAAARAGARSFDRAPFIVIWETTRACALACVHCRAEAIPRRHPDELPTDEARRLIDRVAAFDDPPPLFVFTGGDPLRRPDIAELVAHATARGVTASLTPSGTGAATEPKLRALRDAGLARLAVSLDGATPASHDMFRRVRGSHRHTLRILETARALGLPFQINTTVARSTVAELPPIAREVERMGAVLWALFFLIPIGRAQMGDALDASAIERVLHWAADLAPTVPFGVKTTEAPHYHRVLAGRAGASSTAPARTDLIGRAGRAVTDGNGFLFIDHVGNICPSGFLPLAVANVRADDLVAVYRDEPAFRALRDGTRLGGRCGRCEFRERCGGSRARAFAASGDPLAEDPGCAWEPALPVIAGGSGAAPRTVTEAEVRKALRSVFDPELGLSIVQLGLVYGIVSEGGAVRVTMTLTTPGCPIHDQMGEWVRRTVAALPGVERVDVEITFDPPWTPDRIDLAA